uniref:DNA helicase n=1 Tax=Spongospora subterranea TaxID=70186 RepID=A0A0H5QY66_9EUKA|eukprot:CRZ06591.1 hypothetical protein [Spongospora subterranea]
MKYLFLPQPLFPDLCFSYLQLLDFNADLAHRLWSDPTLMLRQFDCGLAQAQQEILETESPDPDLTVKSNCHLRPFSLPMDTFATRRSVSEIRSDDHGHLVDLHGTVVRTGAVRMLESERQYECDGCGAKFTIRSELETGSTIEVPTACPSTSTLKKRCRSKSFRFLEGSRICHDYQEIRIQEKVKNLSMGSIPRSIRVVLQHDLVDCIQAGADAIITGIVRSQWGRLQPQRACELRLFIEAINVDCNATPPSESHCFRKEFCIAQTFFINYHQTISFAKPFTVLFLDWLSLFFYSEEKIR